MSMAFVSVVFNAVHLVSCSSPSRAFPLHPFPLFSRTLPGPEVLLALGHAAHTFCMDSSRYAFTLRIPSRAHKVGFSSKMSHRREQLFWVCNANWTMSDSLARCHKCVNNIFGAQCQLDNVGLTSKMSHVCEQHFGCAMPIGHITGTLFASSWGCPIVHGNAEVETLFCGTMIVVNHVGYARLCCCLAQCMWRTPLHCIPAVGPMG